MYNGKLFQPARYDNFTKHHLWIALVLTYVFALVLHFGLNEVASYITASFIVNVIGLAYEYGEASGDDSEEGIDPLDLLVNFIGSQLGAVLFLFTLNP